MSNTRKAKPADPIASNLPGEVPTEFEDANGKTWTLPPLDPEAGNKVAGQIARDAIMQPDNEIVQVRLALATVEAALGDDSPELKALYSLNTGDMMTVVQRWLGDAGADAGKSGA